MPIVHSAVSVGHRAKELKANGCQLFIGFATSVSAAHTNPAGVAHSHSP
jgi:hypothetical protein